METYSHKEDIINTRIGHLGSSDAKMLAQTDSIGSVPKGFVKRLAICKGLVEPSNITTKAMQFGDYVENTIFSHLSATNPKFQSNPCWISKKYSRKNVKCLTHPDFVLQDDENKTLSIYECKASKFDFEEVKYTYKAQLYHHLCLGKEVAEKLGKYRVKLYLCHYNTSTVNLDEPFTFDPNLLTVKQIRFHVPYFNLGKAMDIVDAYLEKLDFYTEEEEINADYLPEKVYGQFNQVAQFLREIKEREDKVEEFKCRLYDFMTEKGIKKVSCNDFAFTLVSPTENITTDYKKMFENEIASQHPRKANKLREKYKKVSRRKGFVQIRINNDDNE